MNKIIAKNNHHLKVLIEQEIKLHGFECDLNHLDVSEMTDMSFIFQHSAFNGDISQWNTSGVEIMSGMFYESQFNGDISQWNVSKVVNMNGMFNDSPFNQDIFAWNVSQVQSMNYMFSQSKFNQDISNWNVINLEDKMEMFFHCNAPIPYWAEINDNEQCMQAVLQYQKKLLLKEKLDNNIEIKKNNTLKTKL